MGQEVVFQKPGRIEIGTYEEKPLKPNEVRVKTLFSGISAGTELTLFRGVNPYISKKWNDKLRIFEDGKGSSAQYPIRGGWGYECVGRVIEAGSQVRDVKCGDVVFGAWGHRSTHVMDEEDAKDRKLYDDLDPICGIFAQIGSIGLNAILDADIHVNETVAVFGQGVPGQIVTQLAKLNGAKVVAVDLNNNRLEYSKRFGADYTINAGRCDAAKEIKELTQGAGADVSIEISGSTAALHEAIRATCYNGKVVCSGFFQGIPNGLYLGEEFHHNRINIVSSQISGVAPKLQHRWNRLRMDHTIMELQRSSKLNLKDLITHRYSFNDAQKAFDMLLEGKSECLQVVLDFCG